MIKGRARYTPSQTVFHNVCSGAYRALLVFSRLEKIERDIPRICRTFSVCASLSDKVTADGAQRRGKTATHSSTN